MSDEYSLESRNDLIERHQRYVQVVVQKLLNSFLLPPREREELESAGYIGLVEAADRYDPKSGIPFTAFARMRVRGAIIDYIRSTSHLSGRAYKMARALSNMNLLSEEKAPANLAEVLEFAAQGALTFQMCMQDASQEIEKIEDPEGDPHEAFEKKRQRRVLNEVIAELPEKEREVIIALYVEGKTTTQVADSHKQYTKSWISRIHARALELIREKLEERTAQEDLDE